MLKHFIYTSREELRCFSSFFFFGGREVIVGFQQKTSLTLCGATDLREEINPPQAEQYRTKLCRTGMGSHHQCLVVVSHSCHLVVFAFIVIMLLTIPPRWNFHSDCCILAYNIFDDDAMLIVD